MFEIDLSYLQRRIGGIKNNSIVESVCRNKDRKKLVSVVIPTYYRNKWLKRAINSVNEQTYENIEIIVVDDSGEEHAKELIKGYNVRYISHTENRGGNPARNTGIQAARGDYIQFLDDDDILYPKKVEKQVSLLESTSSVDVAYCGIREEDGTDVRPREDDKGNVLSQALQFDLRPCQTTTMLFDSDFLRQLYPLVDREAADDIGLKIRAAAQTNFDFVDEVLVEKGRPANQRAHKLEYSDELRNIIDSFECFYRHLSDEVERNALTVAHQSRGYRAVGEHWWSEDAVISFGKALYYQRFKDPVLLVAFISSIFGRPVYRLSQFIYHHFIQRFTS